MWIEYGCGAKEVAQFTAENAESAEKTQRKQNDTVICLDLCVFSALSAFSAVNCATSFAPPTGR